MTRPIRFLAPAAAALITLAGLGCATTQTNSPKPVDAGETTPAQVDVAVRSVLQRYIAALNRKNLAEAASLWSPTAKVTPEALTTPDVTDWHFISSELIDATPTTARVQLNFTVQSRTTDFHDGRNVRYVKLALESNGWRIRNIATTP